MFWWDTLQWVFQGFRPSSPPRRQERGRQWGVWGGRGRASFDAFSTSRHFRLKINCKSLQQNLFKTKTSSNKTLFKQNFLYKMKVEHVSNVYFSLNGRLKCWSTSISPDDALADWAIVGQSIAGSFEREEPNQVDHLKTILCSTIFNKVVKSNGWQILSGNNGFKLADPDKENGWSKDFK